MSLPAQRPIVDIINDVTGLLTATEAADTNPGDTVIGTRAWVLSSPTTGILAADSTLNDYDIVDGHRLYLTPRADAAHSPFVDDTMSEVRRTISDNQWRWSDAVRQGGLLIAAGIIALILFIPALWNTLRAPTTLSSWGTPHWIMVSFLTAITIAALGIAIWQPKKPTRWLALLLPLTSLGIAYPLVSTQPAGMLLGAVLTIGALASIPIPFIASRRIERSGLAGGLALIGVTIIGITVCTCEHFGVSILALAAWSSWAPILLLLIAPTIAVNSSGLATLLRQSDTGDAINREHIRARTLRSAALCDALVWFSTALGLLIVATLASGPYWQQGICAFALALILILRSNGFSDARLITPLILSGSIGIALCAGALHGWIRTRKDTTHPHNPWWTHIGGTSDEWMPWLIFGLTSLTLILILLLLLGYKPNDVQEARAAKIISGIDSIISITAVPTILIAQGVLTYYWATI